ncbi:sialate O-acetylesterase [Arthrobacter sp. PM3]|uniref:sialate O-acetylesterase n=1 Tax=Arthrobacter sp. PM3 TaxID=2017685 RepID=UPI001ABF5BFC|nr:sialate O-acetylesterase [Arthrobacter sp. PM3]
MKILHVFLAAGQSNMSGRGLPVGGANDAEDPRIFQYGAKVRSFRPATVPLDMHDSATGISPATTMAREYLKTQPANVGVLVIPAAHGQTGFTGAHGALTWTVGAASAPKVDLPNLAVTQTLEGIAAAKAAGYTVVLKGVLWHQGENNSQMSAATYAAKLDQLIAFFRSKLAAPTLPFVLGRMSPEGIAIVPGRNNVDRSQQETPARVLFTAFAPSKAGGVNRGDTTHFSRSGVQYLGSSYLSAYWRAARVTSIPLSAPVPAIRGTAKVGSTLTVAHVNWTPGTVRLSYQWYRSHVAIVGATGATYRPSAADVGRTLTVKVTGSKSGYASVSRISPGAGKVTWGTLSSAAPSIRGTAKVGATLTAVPGSWGPGTVRLSYQWYRSHRAISGATGRTYKPVSADKGRTLTVTVKGSRPGFPTTSRISAGAAKVTSPTW